ncbi:putative Acyl-CoA N-acyltransferase [Vibrio coralliirubri]|uniref:GNAT family N-acetyltransferase n=1 Tax=Vibrio coralliirubri TaxID=1516159 RepID=UPI0006311545|nr:GNAT family N-acetyltransferase [Vibrio coralliirubri]CDU07754.1 putative Acyl-CoA N-acyltransferase [Vibrio coralliirubri]
MNNVIITQLDPVKVPLVKRFYKEHYPTGKANKSELIYSLLLDNELCGVVRFRTIENNRLLTGMAISKQHRGQQLGSQLMGYCAQHTLTEDDYCFAYAHLTNFYARHKFVQVDPKDLPNGLRVLYERYSNSGKDLIPMHYQQIC